MNLPRIKRLPPRFLLAFALVLFLVAIPQVSHAWTPFGIADVGASVIQQVFYFFSQIVTYIAGFFVAIEAYVVQVVLQLSFNITHSTIVETGFPITLSLANLLFVAGIIIIAVATILHIESYGIKGILWKLLVMAVLVNFGLIISGTILGFSDSITMYMVKSITPDQNGGIGSFADVLSGAFNPQRNVVTAQLNGQLKPSDIKDLQSATNVTGQQFGALFNPILGSILSIFSSVIVLVVLGAMIVMLLMRYIQLSFLLLTLPLVWAVWPFPQFSSKFSQWWEKFWKQAFFPVPLVFCLWLGLMIAQKLSTIGVGKNPLGAFNSVATNSNTGEAAAAITSALGGFIGPLADNLFRAILVGGIMVAGLMVADSMGATFAGTAMNALKAGQNKVKNNLTTRIQRGAKTAGKAVQQRTLGLQKMAVTLQGKTIGKLSEANERAGLAVQNLTLRPRGLEKTRVKVKMSGELRDDKGKLMDDGQGHLLVPVWDDHAHDWKKNEAGEVFDKTTGGFVKGKVKVTSVDMTDKNGAITNLDVKDATQYGLVVDNKPVSQYAYLTKNQAGAVTDVRGTTSLTAERLEHTLHAYEIKPGDILSGKEQAIRKARGELVQEAEKSPGIIHGIVVNPIGETARVFAGIASSEKGRKETKKPGDKKPEKKEPEHH